MMIYVQMKWHYQIYPFHLEENLSLCFKTPLLCKNAPSRPVYAHFRALKILSCDQIYFLILELMMIYVQMKWYYQIYPFYLKENLSLCSKTPLLCKNAHSGPVYAHFRALKILSCHQIYFLILELTNLCKRWRNIINLIHFIYENPIFMLKNSIFSENARSGPKWPAVAHFSKNQSF